MSRLDVTLGGCRSNVLGDYLKALAVHRVVTEQEDDGALSYWDEQEDAFHLVSSLGEESLVAFFLERWRPTPLVTPWNGGSGFYPKDSTARLALEAILASADPRLADYRATIEAARRLVEAAGLHEKPDKVAKLHLLRLCRSWFPEVALTWLDAAFAVGEDARYPALLGTGGNDGRMDFASNYMQRIVELVASAPRGAQGQLARARLRTALLGEKSSKTYESASIGQFSPALAGGGNMTTGVDGDSRVNPWDFVLLLEGALVFAGAAVRRLEAQSLGGASFPFHVRATPAGYPSAAFSEAAAARSELWLPLWEAPTTFSELRFLFAEGRLEVEGRRATSGLEAAEALASLGVDRGLRRFNRFGFQRRNGLSFLACSLGSFEVSEAADGIDLIAGLDADGWLERANRLARDGSLTAAASQELRRLDEAIFDVCRTRRADSREPVRPLTEVLAAAGALESAIARSPGLRKEINPLRSLPGGWLAKADDGSPEFDLAAAFASWGMRSALEPVEEAGRFARWSGEASPPLLRRSLEIPVREGLRRLASGSVDESGPLPVCKYNASPQSVRALLAGQVDPARFGDLLSGLSLLPWDTPRRFASRPVEGEPLDPGFLVLRAVTSPHYLTSRVDNSPLDPSGRPRHPAPRVVTRILQRVLAGELGDAFEIARQRLRGSGVELRAAFRPRRRLPSSEAWAAWAAALLVPMRGDLERRLIESVVLPGPQDRKPSMDQQTSPTPEQEKEMTP